MRIFSLTATEKRLLNKLSWRAVQNHTHRRVFLSRPLKNRKLAWYKRPGQVLHPAGRDRQTPPEAPPQLKTASRPKGLDAALPATAHRVPFRPV